MLEEARAKGVSQAISDAVYDRFPDSIESIANVRRRIDKVREDINEYI